MDATPHAVNVSPGNQASLIVGCLIDGFESCRELIVPAVVKNYQVFYEVSFAEAKLANA